MGLLDREHGSLPPETSVLVVLRTSFSFSLRKETVIHIRWRRTTALDALHRNNLAVM